jgi:superfamily I DNA and/or RNA helicase
MGCDFLADTVHRFQGDERDLMIFSPVVADKMPDGHRISFEEMEISSM